MHLSKERHMVVVVVGLLGEGGVVGGRRVLLKTLVGLAVEVGIWRGLGPMALPVS